MANSLIQQSGGQPQKQPRYVPIHIAKATAGLITNRAALHDPSIGIYARFYGGQPDALLSGLNVEISPQQTWKHRPGSSLFAVLPSRCLTCYPFFNPDGSVTLYMDTATGIYTNPAFPVLLFTKSAGAGQTSFLQIGNVLYMANGVDNKKIINGKIYNWASAGPTAAPTVVVDSVGAGAAASIPWPASTVVTTMGLLKDPNGNIQQLISVNADGTNTTSTVIGTSGVGEPAWNNASGGQVTESGGVKWECFGPVGIWQPRAVYTDASAPGTAANPAVIFDPGGNLFIFNGNGAGSGQTGVNKPNFSGVPLLGHVGDNGFKWFNIGPPKTWAPATAYTQWGASSGSHDNTAFIVEPTTPQAAGFGTASPQQVFFQACITSGTSDSSHTGPMWATTQVQPVTRDGQLNYQFLGSSTRANTTPYTAWQTGTPFFNVVFDGTNLQVCLVGGLSGAGAPSWQTAYGTITNDGTVQWVCVGPPVSWAATTKWFLPAGGFAPPVANVNPYGGVSVLDANSNVEFVTSSGKTNSTAPSWATTVGATTTDSGATWTLTALASSFKGSTALAFTKGYGYTYAWKERSATDFYITNAPNGQPGALGDPTGSATGGITTAAPVYQMPVGSNAGAVMQVSGAWPTDTQYDTVVVYRSTDGFQSGPYLELTEIAAPQSVNGVYPGTWTFYDSIPDINLNINIEADTVGLNSAPPVGLLNLELNMNRIWGNVSNIVYASSGPDIPPDNGNGYEGWAPANTYPLRSPVQKNIATTSGLLAFTNSEVYIIAGGPSASQFFPWRIARGIGLLSTNAIQSVGGEIFMVTADKRFIAFQPGVGHTEPGFPIADQIATFNPAQVYVTEHANGQDPSAFYVCDGATGWFRLVPNAAPGFISTSQPVWSPFAAITGGCTGVQSVETASGIRSLLIYQADGKILYRNQTNPQDNGVSFAGNYVVGSIVLAHPGQLAELGFLTLEFSKAGSPQTAYRLNEIADPAPWQTFTSKLYDPPEVYGNTAVPQSYNPYRYEFKQSVNNPSGLNKTPPALLARHMQMRVSYPAENAFHELFSFCIDGALHAEL